MAAAEFVSARMRLASTWPGARSDRKRNRRRLASRLPLASSISGLPPDSPAGRLGHELRVLLHLGVDLGHHDGVLVAEELGNRHRIHAVLESLGGVSLAEGPQVQLATQLLLEAAEGAVDRVLRPGLAFRVAEDLSVWVSLDLGLEHRRRLVGEIDDA